MISFRGYGFLIVVTDYFGGLLLASRFIPLFFKTEKQQYIILVLFHILITCINFFLAKYLNRKTLKHTVYEIRLETFVWITGFILLLPIMMMGKDIIY